MPHRHAGARECNWHPRHPGAWHRYAQKGLRTMRNYTAGLLGLKCHSSHIMCRPPNSQTKMSSWMFLTAAGRLKTMA